MHQAAAQSSNPQAAITIAEHVFRMRLTRRLGIGISGLESSINESSDSPFQGDQQRAVVFLREVLDTIRLLDNVRLAPKRIESRRTRLPKPQSVQSSCPQPLLA